MALHSDSNIEYIPFHFLRKYIYQDSRTNEPFIFFLFKYLLPPGKKNNRTKDTIGLKELGS